jgi:hypothetical protein
MKAFLILYLVVLCGCARRPAAPGSLTFVVGPECHPSAVEEGCNSAAVPRCSQIALRYDKGCEKLLAKSRANAR